MIKFEFEGILTSGGHRSTSSFVVVGVVGVIVFGVVAFPDASAVPQSTHIVEFEFDDDDDEGDDEEDVSGVADLPHLNDSAETSTEFLMGEWEEMMALV